MKKFFIITTTLSILLVSPLFTKEHIPAKPHEHWDYAKHGPKHWGDFSGTCKNGKLQSPINIIPAKSISLDSSYTLKIDEDINTKAKIFDNGHSIKVIPNQGGWIKINGKKYKLIQFHFHGKSEHTIDGRQYDMVAHMVHKSEDGKLAVIAVLFEIGEKNPFIQKILDNIGKEIDIDPQKLLPKDTNHFYHYVGSLTTPPCTEGVEWFILKDTDSISKEQLKHFRKFYENNERPIQAINNRIIQTK